VFEASLDWGEGGGSMRWASSGERWRL